MYLECPSVETILGSIAQLNPQEDEVIFLLIGELAPMSIDTLITQLKTTNLPFVGVIFPAIISSEIYSKSGVLLKKFPIIGTPYLIQNINQQISLPNFEAEIALMEERALTAMVWIDGLTSRISDFLVELYNHLGNSVRYLGGGAGSLSLCQKPCIFTQAGCFQDAAIICFIPLDSQLGVQHGWQRLKGPIPATQTQHSTITELNWRNAFEVYKEVVEADSQTELTRQNFFEIAKGYPFGIFKEGQEDIVRDPILVDEAQALVCVGEVPENALLYILRGDPQSLINSARQAATEALQGDRDRLQDVLIVDCISRVLFLGQQFSEELTALREMLLEIKDNHSVEGVLTLGEISSYGEGFLEFFNKTIVVGAFYL